MMNHKVHLSGLNGIRAIAALAVVFSHLGMDSESFGIEAVHGIDLAGFGVTIFFCLSGFLITYLLLLEKEQAVINIRNFYLRRLLRIWPLYFLYLFICLITTWQTLEQKLLSGVPFYFLLAANVPFTLGTTLPFLAHYWSLGVEEQFYLFWPWVIKKFRRPLVFIIPFTIVIIIVRILFRLLEMRQGHSLPYLSLTVTRFDCMAIGGVGAVLFNKHDSIFWRISTSLIAQIFSWGVIILLAFNKFHLASVIDHQIIAVLTVILIVNVSSNPKTIIRLENQVPDFIGKISYGIYVIHPLVIYYCGKIVGSYSKQLSVTYRYVVVYLLVPALILFIAYILYEFYEKPFLTLKDRFSRIKSSSNLPHKTEYDESVITLIKEASG